MLLHLIKWVAFCQMGEKGRNNYIQGVLKRNKKTEQESKRQKKCKLSESLKIKKKKKEEKG